MANDDTTASVVTDDSLLAPMPKPVMTARKAAQPQQQAAKDAADNLPQFSRIFVVCNKSTTEAELHQLFSPYGTIEYVCCHRRCHLPLHLRSSTQASIARNRQVAVECRFRP